MEPEIKNGGSVIVSCIPYFFSKPKIGDVVAFKKNRKVFIKRISKIDEENYFVKGDNKRDSLDSGQLGWIKRKNILGKVIWNI